MSFSGAYLGNATSISRYWEMKTTDNTDVSSVVQSVSLHQYTHPIGHERELIADSFRICCPIRAACRSRSTQRVDVTLGRFSYGHLLSYSNGNPLALPQCGGLLYRLMGSRHASPLGVHNLWTWRKPAFR